MNQRAEEMFEDFAIASGAATKTNNAESESSTEAAATTLKLVDMPETVLCGRLGEIFQKRLSRLPLAYGWSTLVTVAGAMVPPSGIRTNCYTALVGPVGSGKSEAAKSAIWTMGISSPVLQSVMSGSAEGLLAKLEDAAGAPRLVNPDELGHLLEKSQIEHASFPYILNRAYNESQFDVTLAHGKQIPFDAALSCIGGLVEDKFQQLFGAATIGGLYDRFVFGICPTGFVYCYRPFAGSPEDTAPCVVSVDSDVWELKDEWLRTIPGLSGRVAELALRVAAICASFDGSRRLRAEYLGPARAFAEYQIRARTLLKPNPGENTDAKCAAAILATLERHAPHGEWLPCREVYKVTHGERFGPGAFSRAVTNLVFNEQIETQTDRKKKLIHLAP